MANRMKGIARGEKIQQRINAGLLSARFPEVTGITIHMTYYQKGVNPVLMERTVNFFPGSYAYFNMECMSRDCVDGGFDFDRTIASMVRGHRESAEGELVCEGHNVSTDHSKVGFRIVIGYRNGAL